MNKILVIEDHFEVRENLQELLELCNYIVISAPDGERGIELALSRQPDLILCDITMPGIDGFEVLANLCQHPESADIPFIFLSARTEKQDIRKGMQLGADDYLTKPFEEEELLKAIQVRLHKSHLTRPSMPISCEGLDSFLFQAKKEGGIQLETEVLTGIQKFGPGEMVFRENEIPEYLYFVASGKIRTYQPGQPSSQLLSTVFEKGSFLGYDALIRGTAHQHCAEALEPSEVSLISKNDFFLLLLHNRTFSVRFIQLLANRVREQEKQLLNMVQLLSQKAVAETILSLYPSFARAENDAIPLEAVQSKVSVASLNFALALRHFDNQKVISLVPEGIRLLDKQKLGMAANG